MTTDAWPSDAWRPLGNCWDNPQVGLLLFASEDSAKAARLAAKLCSPCPVRLDCLRYAARISPEYGFWGGEPAKVIRRRRRQILADTDAPASLRGADERSQTR